jgi:hypothetical protein
MAGIGGWRAGPESTHSAAGPYEQIRAACRGGPVNLCYADESGTGDEPIAVMVGIVVDASRMHVTKEHWGGLLAHLSTIAGKDITELHTRNFYSGNGVWRGMKGADRASIIFSVFEWLAERKHHVVYSSVVKKQFHKALGEGDIPSELATPWRFLGFHLVLSIQKVCGREKKNKGNTIFVFDNEEREKLRFTDLIHKPPPWSDGYYGRKKNAEALDQIVDAPYFGDSKEVALIQVADVAAFFLRRYAEIKESLVPAKYPDEEERVTEWIEMLVKRSLGVSAIYPKVGRTEATDLFWKYAAPSIRALV